jgi:hypothetical protein
MAGLPRVRFRKTPEGFRLRSLVRAFRRFLCEEAIAILKRKGGDCEMEPVAGTKQMHRVVTFLDRDQVDFLDKLGKDTLFSTGLKFPRTRIISALVDLLRKANVSGEGLRSEAELEERLIQKLTGRTSEARRLANEIVEGSHAPSPRVRG